MRIHGSKSGTCLGAGCIQRDCCKRIPRLSGIPLLPGMHALITCVTTSIPGPLSTLVASSPKIFLHLVCDSDSFPLYRSTTSTSSVQALTNSATTDDYIRNKPPTVTMAFSRFLLLCAVLAQVLSNTMDIPGEPFRAPLTQLPDSETIPDVYLVSFRRGHTIADHWRAIGWSFSSHPEFTDLPLFFAYIAELVLVPCLALPSRPFPSSSVSETSRYH